MIDTINYKPDYTKFGGIINYSDFDVYYSPSDTKGYHTLRHIAEKIGDDSKFDERCKRNIKESFLYTLNRSRN